MSGSMDFGVASPIPHWAIHLSLTPHSSPFQVRPTSRSDYRTGAIGLLGFYRFYRFYLYRAFGLLSFMLFPISDFRFMLYFIFRMLSMLGF